VDPLTLSITSLPPTLPAFAAVEELFELPPHAVARINTLNDNATHLKRFIDTLRSRFYSPARCGAESVRSHLALPDAKIILGNA
jgi:hypothetical protein